MDIYDYLYRIWDPRQKHLSSSYTVTLFMTRSAELWPPLTQRNIQIKNFLENSLYKKSTLGTKVFGTPIHCPIVNEIVQSKFYDLLHNIVIVVIKIQIELIFVDVGTNSADISRLINQSSFSQYNSFIIISIHNQVIQLDFSN